MKSSQCVPIVGDRAPPANFPWWIRLILLAAGGVLIGLLITAAMLTPDPSGMGTHQQLGLPPCSFTEMFGMRCPSCGMTTSWAHFVRGNIVQSQQANTGGLLLAMIAATGGPWLFISGLKGSWLWRRPNDWLIIAIAGTVICVTLIDWSIRSFG